MPIDWDTQPREMFDRLVEALVTRWYPAADADVRPINGRGGDGGRDIEVVQGSRRRVFQLKHFPEGFSSTWRQRRRQITRSMDSIADDPPDVWTLVVPCTLTDGERNFVLDEASTRGLKNTNILDRAKLEAALAQHSDLVSYFNRGDELREDARIYNRERDALLGGPPDLGQRLRDLSGVVDAQDPHWTMDFSRHGGSISYALRAKHAQAAAMSPITCTLELDMGVQHAALAAQWTQGMNYGLTEPISFPPEAVRRWTVDGPDWLRTDLANVSLELHPADSQHVRRAVELRFVNEDTTTSSSFTSFSTDARRGAAGVTLQLEVNLALRLTFLMPLDLDQPTTVNLHFYPAGAKPHDILDATEVLQELYRGTTLHLCLDGTPLAQLGRSGTSQTTTRLRDLIAVVGLAEDLDAVSRHARQQIPYPTTITRSDRIILRALRLAIEGRCALLPQPTGIRATLADGDLSGVLPLLRGPSFVKATSDRVELELLDRIVTIRGLTVFHPQVSVDDSDQVIAAINAGTAGGMQIHLRPPDGELLRMYLDGHPALDQPLTPTPWRIPGIADR